MSNFKVGDKVRLMTGAAPFRGAEGKITRDDGTHFRPLQITLDKVLGGHRYAWRGHEELELVKAAPKARSRAKPEPAPEASIRPCFVVVAMERMSRLSPHDPKAAIRGAKYHETRADAVERAKDLAGDLGKSFVVLQVVAEVSIEHVPATTKVTVKEI